ncbi:hypothetical protein DZA50_01675 [Kangiella sp. HD9-110m-PIT-SAG07]|nr:hypothetical protein DZA50_01675 [Kangiella sp. HD9-110m-PIT-SAG07]
MVNKATKLLGVATGLLVLGMSSSDKVFAVERGPLLISEVPTHQMYSEEDINDIKLQEVISHKGNEQNTLEKEYSLFQKIKNINSNSLSPDQVEFLKTASKHQATAYTQHPEGPIAVQIFDVASLAKHKLFLHDVELQKSTLEPFWDSNPSLFVKKSLESSVNAQAAKALLNEKGELSSVNVELLVDAYSSTDNIKGHSLLQQLVAKTSSMKAAQALLNSSHKSPIKHQLLSSLEKYFSEIDQETLLREQVTTKSELTSQALIEYGKLPLSVIKIDILYSKLSDAEVGASSAFALSKILKVSSDYSQLLNNLKEKKNSRIETANSLLALKMANSPDANHVLRKVLENDYIQFDDIKAEVTTWLN